MTAKKKTTAKKATKKPAAKRSGRPKKGHEADWSAIKHDYQTGVMSMATIGAKHGVSKEAVRKRAEKEGWDRDLTAAVKRATARRLAARASGKVAGKVAANRAEQEQADADIVDGYAQQCAEVVESHRKDITYARQHVADMSIMARQHSQQIEPAVAELALQRAQLVAEQSGRKLKKGEKRATLYTQAYLLGVRLDFADKAAAVTAKLVGSIEKLIKLEREAYSLGTEDGTTDYDEEIRRLTAAHDA